MYRNVRLAAPPPPVANSRGRSVIAAIGIDHYAAWPRLHNAVNDARGAARLFTQLGFTEVTGPLLDAAATGEAMRRLITTDLSRLAAADSLVVFFAGHGHTDTAVFDDVTVKTGYLIPADGEDAGGHGEATWLRLDSWLSDIARLPPRHILVMIDACHSGVALSALHKWRGGVAATGGLDALQARRSRCIITSALDDQRAVDGGPYPGHSLFTGCLIEGLTGGLGDGGRRVATGREIGEYLQRRVRSYPHTAQTPDFGAFELDDRGDIVVPILGADAAPGLLIGSAGIGARDVGEPSGQLEARDAALELPAIEIHGVVHQPQALLEPWVPYIKLPPGNSPTDLVAAQRARIARTTDPSRKRAQAIVLAALLYRKHRGASLAGRAAGLGEAREIVRGVVQQAGGRAVDDTVLRLLGACELLLQDYPAAEQTWRALVDRNPAGKDAAYHRAWLAYAQLRQRKHAAAVATVADQPLDDSPELAYVAAWVRWQTGDNPGAWQAIAAAARQWTRGQDPYGVEHRTCLLSVGRDFRRLQPEVQLFAGHTGVAPEQAAAVVKSLLEGTFYAPYKIYARLALDGYGPAGRWALGLTALDRAIEVARDAMAPDDRVAIRYAQADFAVRLGMPDAAAKYASQTVDALAVCKDCSAEDRADTVRQLYAMAGLFHELYTAADDRRYYAPARDLYAMTIPLLDNGATRAQAERAVAALDAGGTTAGTGAGLRDEALGKLVARHNEEVRARFEQALCTHPQLRGTIALDLEVDPGGAVRAASASTTADAELLQVARDVAEQARQWKLPAHRTRGTAHVKLSYALAADDAQDATKTH